jgi:hypothetical protein
LLERYSHFKPAADYSRTLPIAYTTTATNIMTRILPIVALLLASAFTTQAALYCQCLYKDGSHCCVIAVCAPPP